MVASSVVQSLVRMREEMGLTQAEVASRLGTSQPVIARFEQGGRDPRLSTVQRYARAVGADIEVAESAVADQGTAARLSDQIAARLGSDPVAASAVFREVVQFLDDTRNLSSDELAEAIGTEPLSTGERRWDAVVAAAVEWVATLRGVELPRWVTAHRWTLPAPGWVVTPHERLHPIVRANTPPAFARHGVYVDGASLQSV